MAFNPNFTSPSANPLNHWCMGLPTTGPFIVKEVAEPLLITPGATGMTDILDEIVTATAVMAALIAVDITRVVKFTVPIASHASFIEAYWSALTNPVNHVVRLSAYACMA